jgi:hypothetical protein
LLLKFIRRSYRLIISVKDLLNLIVAL